MQIGRPLEIIQIEPVQIPQTMPAEPEPTYEPESVPVEPEKVPAGV